MGERFFGGILGLLLLIGCSEPAAPVAAVGLPEPESPGAKSMKAVCSQCHGVPQPTSHIAKDWPNIVARMNDHRIMLAMKAISDEQRVIILDYLQKHAGQS